MKLIDSIAVDHVVGNINALMQTRQAGLRVRDGAEAMIEAVRELKKDRDKCVLMQGGISNAYGSINRLLSC